MSGTLPTELGLLTSLMSLQLDGNRLTGTIPSELARLSLLETLSLGGGNRIDGSVPSQVCAMLSRNGSCATDNNDDGGGGDSCLVSDDPLELTIDCNLVTCSCGGGNCTCDDATV